jgi:hypothetical protein
MTQHQVFVSIPASSFGQDMFALIRESAGEAFPGGRISLHLSDSSPYAAAAPPDRESLRKRLEGSDVVVADLSGSSPNVLYELGLAHSLGKPVILLSDDPGAVPFDLRRENILLYSPTAGTQQFVARVSNALRHAVLRQSFPEAQQLEASKSGRKLFISYAHTDIAYLDRILVHLRPLERSGAIDHWSDTRLRAGDQWRGEIEKALRAARTAILLVSADFLASDFIVANELPPLLKAAEDRGTRIIPVIIKPSRFVRDQHLSRFQALNDHKRPVISMTEGEREALYAKLAEEVELDIGGP